jgi:hypothetical protein
MSGEKRVLDEILACRHALEKQVSADIIRMVFLHFSAIAANRRPMLSLLKYFGRKCGEKNWRFLFRILLLSKQNLDIKIGF